jgi:signal transduction histidine kinase
MGPSRQWRYYFVCAVGFVVALLAYRAQWRCSEFPPGFVAHDLAYPAVVAGYEAATPERLRFLVESWPPGATLIITDAEGAQQVVTTVLRQGTFALVLTGLGGMVFLTVAAFFFAPHVARPGAASFFWLCYLYGLGIMVGGVFFPRENTVLLTALGLVQYACLASLPVIFVKMSLAFPRRSPVLDRSPWLLPVLCAFAVFAFGWQALVSLRYFAAPTVEHGAALAPAHAFADLFMVALTVAGIVIVAVRGRRLDLTRERVQVRWLLWGFTIGAAPYVLLRTLPTLVGLPPLLPEHVDRVIELAIPVAFVMAVVRHRFLDIDVIIRRSLLYALIAAALLAFYLLVGLAFGHRFETPRGLDPWVPPVLLGLGAGFAFLPLRRGLGRWIDRTFFKLAYDQDRILAHLDGELVHVADRVSLAKVLLRQVQAALLPVHAAVAVVRDDDLLVAGDLDADTARVAFASLVRDDQHGFTLSAAPLSTSLPELERTDYPQRLQSAGVVLVQPVVCGEGPGGVVLVGPRTTGRRYVEQDVSFLVASAKVAGGHLERIVLQQAVAREAVARERLAELNRLKSEFLAQVAHDLRTPVAGIAWSARNLLDGIAGELTPNQAETVRAVAQSGGHLDRLVNNLLELSRLDQTTPRLELAPVSVAEVWREAIDMLRPLAQAKGVKLALHGDTGAATVLGNRDKLMEVATNLLDNAVKYAGPGTSVDVTCQAPAAGSQAVSVRDHGPGLAGQTLADLLARFAQGQPSPHSSQKGFGLGLHIVATYLELMGGSLTAEDHPEGGAVFTTSLPLARSQAGA